MKIKGFLLDLDGVITETSEYHYLAWKELSSEIGIAIDRTFNEQLKGVSRMDSLERILIHGGKEHLFTQQEKQAFAQRKNERYIDLLRGLTPDDLLPGIGQFLADARADGIKLAIASASRNAGTIVRKLGLEAKIDYIADAASTARSKPYPDIFLDAARGLFLPPDSCVGIEDAAAGITAIHAAGMKAIGIGSAEYLHEADLILSGTEDLVYDRIVTILLSIQECSRKEGRK